MIKKTLALAIGLTSAQLVMAQGFYVDEQSALRLGDAFSGGAAQADDASTAFYNPAGLTRLKQKQLTINLSAISVTSEFSGASTTLGGATVNGKDVSAEALDVLPSIYFSAPMSEKFVFGAYLNAPYATGTDFGDDSVGRYFATESSITGIDFGTALGFQVSDNLSFGISMIMQYLSATVAQAINTSAACKGAELQGDLGPFSCPDLGIADAELGNTPYDSQFEMQGDDLNIGFTLGMLYEFSPNSRLGLHYKNRISHDLQGNATLEVPTAAETFGNLAGLVDTKAKGTATLETPSQANLSFYQGLGKFALQADIQWSQWSSFDTLSIKSDSNVIQGVASPQTYDWVESYRYALGGSYQMTPSLTLRTGLALDQTPIKDEQTKVDFAFDDYKALSFGLSYVINKDLAFDFGIQKTLKQKRAIAQGDITDPSQNLSKLKGDVSTDVLSLAAGIKMTF
ncbi:MAG: long-chain fatty acid transport protein [Oleispira sp.]|jgi:long-chain fatty acid transport protein